MTIKQIFNLGLEIGIAADPRGKRGVEKWLERQKKIYHKLSRDEREFFDRERLVSPYADSAIHFGEPDTKVKTILAGVEAEEAEIALVSVIASRAKQSKIRDRFVDSTPRDDDKKIDLVITHHPIGKALAALDEVMHLQADLMVAYGVPINIAEGVMRERISQVSRSLSPANHMKTVDAARLAHMPILNLHTPCDNLVYEFLQKMMDRKSASRRTETVGEIIELLRKIPEYKIAAKNNSGPRIFAGSPENQAGKVVAFDITGGTEGAKEVYPELSRAGIGTIIGMHMKEENREVAIKNHLNVVIAGHISSDSIGMNLFLDRLAAKNIKIIPCGGLIRVKRR